ncbi:MAG: [Elusimicrobiaceae bacterium]|nr:[FeFe] hydrogenase H-cluster radical SAM maturase HydE [Elusimicrobiaceae bacterium]
MNCTQLIEKAEQTHLLTEEELAHILTDSQIDDILFAAADRVRRKYVGDEVHLRALIEFTNICRNQCLYCGLQRQNKALQRYRLSAEEILSLAQKAANYGYKTLVLQGGEDAFFTAQVLVPIIQEIKKMGLALTLSIGERTREDYAALKQAGADRFLLRIETTDKALYEKYNPGMSFENRLRCLTDLRELGYEVGTGILVGLPGQTVTSLAKDILFFKQLDADMIGLGPFIPNPDTPLKDAPAPKLTPALKVMALTRLLLPDINIPATTAMETIQPDGRLRALQSGANVVMPNVTEGEARLNYALYPGKACAGEDPSKCRGCLTAKLHLIGRSVSTGYGFHKKISE